jgi:hypothetical protein
MRVGDRSHDPDTFSRKRAPGNRCTGGWVGSRVGPDGYGKSSPNRDSIPGPSVSEDDVMIVVYHESFSVIGGYWISG